MNIGLAVSLVLLASSTIVNAEVANDAATVTVQNAFTIASTTPIDFGVLRVTQSVAQTQATPSRTILDVDGTQTAVDGTGGTGSLTVISAGTPGRIDVTAAAPFTSLSIALDGDTNNDFTGAIDEGTALDGINNTDLTTAGAGANDKFTMFVNAADTRIEGGLNDGSAYNSGATNLRTDGAGAVGLSFGGMLVWNYASIESPADTTYTGNYSITVNY